MWPIPKEKDNQQMLTPIPPKMLELSSKGFKEAIKAMFHEANYLTISGKRGVPRRETEAIKRPKWTELKLEAGSRVHFLR